VRASHPTLKTVGRALADHREAIISDWAEWLTGRCSPASLIPRGTLDRELRLLFDLLLESVGPMRRSVAEVWYRACEHYGRCGAARGLAAGDIVEEIQYLRELLIRRVGPVLSGLRQRQAMAIILRLSTILDKGIAVAVVGYTDALVATLLSRNGVPSSESSLDGADIGRQLEQIEGELAAMVRHR
jgi:hypothetical protein